MDSKIQEWFETRHQQVIDFEVDDALDKLQELDLVTAVDNKFTAVSLTEAKVNLDRRWDQYF